MADKPYRFQLRRLKGWTMPPNSVSVARPGPLGNPFVVGTHGTVERCVYLHKALLAGLISLSDSVPVETQTAHYNAVMTAIPTHRGKNLGCFCRPDRPCHADALLGIFNHPFADKTVSGLECLGMNQ